MNTASFDFAVLGAGPAGSIAASQLAGSGARVLLIDRARRQTGKPGEFLPGRGKAFINAYGLAPAAWESDHLCIGGFVNGWGRSEPAETSFVFDPYGSALALDRDLFERQLVERAVQHGAAVRFATELAELTRDRSGWRLRLRGDESGLFRADHLVLATGRSSPPPGISFRRYVFDRLAFIAVQVCCPTDDLRPCLETHPDGWVYVTPTPADGIIFYVFFEGGGAVPRARSLDSIGSTIAGCRRSSDILARATQNPNVSPRWLAGPAYSSMSRPMFGNGWSMVGDAAQSHDPLSSNGILAAAMSASRIAGHLAQAGEISTALAADLEEERTHAFTRYLKDRERYYASETRWPSSRFWRKSRAG